MQWLIKILLNSFKYCKKNNSKIQILKLLKDQKILTNQMIHYLKIIETKIYIYMTKQKRKMSYIQKNNLSL